MPRGAGATCTRRFWRRWKPRPSTWPVRGWRITPRRRATPTPCCGTVVAAAERGARTGAHREAAAQYARVLRHADALSAAERADLLLGFALESEASGEYEASITSLKHAIDLRRSLGDRLRAGDHLARLTVLYMTVGHNAEAEAASRSAVETLEALPASAELATAYGIRAYAQMVKLDNDDAVRWAEKAVALARRLDEPESLARGLTVMGAASVTAGDIQRGVGLLEHGLEIARAHELEHRIAYGHWMLGWSLGEMYELDLAERSLRDHIAFAEEHDLGLDVHARVARLVLVYRGRWADGGALAADVLAARAPAVTEITANVALGRLRARRGDPDEGALDAALALRPAGRNPPAPPPRARRAGGGGLALRRPGFDVARSPDRLSACAREAPSLVRRGARVLAVEGRRADPGARVDRRAVSPADRGQPRGAPPSVGGHEGARMRRRARWPSPTPVTSRRR